MKGRVLVVDDETDWVETFAQWLEPDGYAVRGAATAAEALAIASEWGPHVALVDQRLEGPGGRDLGLTLIGELTQASPTTRVVLVTAFATPQAVQVAFQRGASDYMEKTALLQSLVRGKLPDLVTAAEHASGALDWAAAEAELAEAWRRAHEETDSQRKGAALEETVRRVFESIPGFRRARLNRSNGAEEIDVIVTNRSHDPLLARQGDFIVAECKNWSSSVGVPEFVKLREKLAKRYGRARLGLLIALGGFTTTIKREMLTERRGEYLILLVDKAGLEDWIAAADRRGEWLIQRIEAAVVAG